LTNLDPQWAESEWRRLIESRPKRNLRRRLSLGFLALFALSGIVLGICWRKQCSRWAPLTIRSVEISGNRVVATSEVLDLLGVRAGDPWWNFSARGVRAHLAEHPQIRTLSLRYGWFHRLCVDMTEREPVMAVLGSIGGQVTTDGWFLSSSGYGEDEDLVILRPAPGTLPAPGSPVDRQTAAVARLVDSLHHKDVSLWRELSEVEVTGGEARAYMRSQPGIILFRPGVHDELWDSVPAVLSDLRGREAVDLVLDLRFSGRIVVRLPETVAGDTLFAPAARERV
jgi:hypothetical protein